MRSVRAGPAKNKSAANVLGEQQSILALFSDKICLTTTTAPQANSTDNWATEANQTANANTANINAYNDAIRAGVAGSVGYFDISDATSSARNSGKWKTDGTASKYTADGLHNTPFGYAEIAASGVVDASLIVRI